MEETETAAAVGGRGSETCWGWGGELGLYTHPKDFYIKRGVSNLLTEVTQLLLFPFSVTSVKCDKSLNLSEAPVT